MVLAGYVETNMIKQLTGIRAILAWWVVLLHILCNDKMAGYFRYSRLFSRGYLAVDGFFVLSGLILCHVYAGGLSSPSLAKCRSFLIARIARIYPVHLLMLAAFVPAVIANHWLHLPNSMTSFSARDLLLSICLVQAWGFIRHPAWNGGAWSISAEWFLYLLFPVFLFLLVKKQSLFRAGIVTALCVMALHWVKVSQENTPGPEGLYRTVLVLVSANFALGCVAYVVVNGHGRSPAWVGTAAAAGCKLCASLHLDEWFSFLFAILVIALSSDADRLSGILSRKVMIYPGETSSSLYMVHLYVWEIVAAIAHRGGILKASGAPYVVGIGLIAAVAASSFLYHVVEVPSRDYIRGLSRQRRVISESPS